MDARGDGAFVKYAPEFDAPVIDVAEEALPPPNAPPLTRPMRILFAPDWRAGVPYQSLLAEALVRRGANVKFAEHYKRVLPLHWLLRDQECDILHLHWPEAYYPRKADALDLFRAARFPYDLDWAIRRTNLVTTAHDFKFIIVLASFSLNETYVMQITSRSSSLLIRTVQNESSYRCSG